MELVVILAGMILMWRYFLLPPSFSRLWPFVFVAAGVLMVAWGYDKKIDKPDSFVCAETDGETICAFKGRLCRPQDSQKYVCEKVDGNMLCERLATPDENR